MKKIIFLLLLVVLFTGCGDATAQGNSIIMPAVEGMTLSEALDSLTSAGAENISYDEENLVGWDYNKVYVISQSIVAGNTVKSGKEIKLVCKKLCRLYVDVKSEDNLLLNKYDMNIYLDDQFLGVVANGNTLTCLNEVLEGEHEIRAYKDSDDSVHSSKKINISADMTFNSSIKHGGSITFEDVEVLDEIVGADIEVPNLVGAVLREAMNELKETGFVNIKYQADASIWDENNWIVTSQNVEAGITADKNTYIQLECISFDDFCEKAFVGKNAMEIYEIAEKNNFEMQIEDAKYNDIADKVSKMDDDEKKKWVVVSARKYGGKDKSAYIVLEKKNANTANSNNTTSSTNKNNTNKKPSTAGAIYEYACKRECGNYDMYYLFDTDAKKVVTFTTDDVSALEGTFSGTTSTGFDISYSSDWSERIDFFGSQVTLYDNDGFTWEFERVSADKAEEIFNKQIKSTYTVD